MWSCKLLNYLLVSAETSLTGDRRWTFGLKCIKWENTTEILNHHVTDDISTSGYFSDWLRNLIISKWPHVWYISVQRDSHWGPEVRGHTDLIIDLHPTWFLLFHCRESDSPRLILWSTWSWWLCTVDYSLI